MRFPCAWDTLSEPGKSPLAIRAGRRAKERPRHLFWPFYRYAGGKIKVLELLAMADGDKIKVLKLLAMADGGKIKVLELLAMDDGGKIKVLELLAMDDGGKIKVLELSPRPVGGSETIVPDSPPAGGKAKFVAANGNKGIAHEEMAGRILAKKTATHGKITIRISASLTNTQNRTVQSIKSII